MRGSRQCSEGEVGAAACIGGEVGVAAAEVGISGWLNLVLFAVSSLLLAANLRERKQAVQRRGGGCSSGGGCSGIGGLWEGRWRCLGGGEGLGCQS